MEKIEVKLEIFEGPLDLLLHLIDKNEVDIYDIPISLITLQYMDYLEKMRESGDVDLSRMSDFLVMASTLLDIKCRMLLPKEKNEEGEEIDPRDELVQKLLEYKIYKYMSFELKDMQIDAGHALFKPSTMPKEILDMKPPLDYEKLIGKTTLISLNHIFQEVLKRQENKIDPIRSKFGRIEKEEVSAKQKLADIKSYAMEHGSFSFRNLLGEAHTRQEVVVTFLVLLEMMKTGAFKASQAELGSDIMITVTDREALSLAEI
ncbi:MAG: segregation/condensation protein A [Lachnospiraceae bacterium]|nr:segregation/condensation protein A [Lachnospiraceae bacterium]